jgi:hypothetical protein
MRPAVAQSERFQECKQRVGRLEAAKRRALDQRLVVLEEALLASQPTRLKQNPTYFRFRNETYYKSQSPTNSCTSSAMYVTRLLPGR